LLDAGGRVLVVGHLPVFAAGLDGDDAAVRAFASHPRVERVIDASAAADALAGLRGHATSDVPLLVRRNGLEAAALVTGAFPSASAYPRRHSEKFLWEDNDFDSARYADERIVSIDARVIEAEVWNPATGAREAVRLVNEGETSSVAFATGGAPAVILVWREAADGEHAETSAGSMVDISAGDPESGVEMVADVSDGWRGSLVPTIDNTWGDLALPVGIDVDRLQIWTMDWRESSGEWSVTKAGYGNRLRFSDPVPAGQIEALDADEVAAILAGTEPLAPESWGLGTFSSSRGIEKPGHGALGNKGVVPEEFVRVACPPEGHVVSVRVVVETATTGHAEVVVSAGASKRVWWNGIECEVGDGNVSIAAVEIDRPVNILEYQLGESRNAPGNADVIEESLLGSSFTVAPAGAYGSRPVFMKVGPDLIPSGTVRYRGELCLESDATRANLVVGTAAGATVMLDGDVIARHEKVDYYESFLRAIPAYFSHDLTARLAAGTHTVEVVTDSNASRDVVFVDLVVVNADGVTTLTSGRGWSVESGGSSSVTVEHLGHWGELAPMHAAGRPHPLPETEWLHGAPVVGSTVPAFHTTDDVVPAPQEFRFVVPSGTAAIELPLALDADVTVDGVPVTIEGGVVRLGSPLQAVATVEVRTAPTAFLRAGSAWTGPARVSTIEAPVELGDWRHIGLAGWSGGVRYRRVIEVGPASRRVCLDLGHLRGSVRLEVDGEVVGEAFCAPFRFDLGHRTGSLNVAITINNTLAPFLNASTPTAWVFPSQLESGLMGPVTVSLT